jgi:hypothetical protein
MVARPDLEIELDFSTVQRHAERVRSMVLEMRERFDLTPFEFTKKLRIAPTEMPHSHPRLTLNRWVRDEIGLLTTYLHEQLHWYETWFSQAHEAQWREILSRLRQRYPTVPVGGADGARDEFSTYLHLVVNWLEVDVAARFVERAQVERHVRALPFYRWCYATALMDCKPLGALYEEQGLLPLRHAGEMSEADMELAARSDETTK